MSSRGRNTPYEKRTTQAPGMMRHGSFPSAHRTLDSLPPLPTSDLLENKIAIQAAEMEQLDRDNHRMASTQIALRQELSDAHHEVQRLKSHIGSLQTESNIQIRVLSEKIAKMENEIKNGENVKKDLQQAHMEAQSLVKARQELVARFHQASQELQKATADIKTLPDLLDELESLRQEHERIHVAFEFEKGSNLEQVEQLKAMENNFYGMVKEMEALQAQVSNAENKEPNPYGSGGYIRPDFPYPPSLHPTRTYLDEYGRPLTQTGIRPPDNGMNPYFRSNDHM